MLGEPEQFAAVGLGLVEPPHPDAYGPPTAHGFGARRARGSARPEQRRIEPRVTLGVVAAHEPEPP